MNGNFNLRRVADIPCCLGEAPLWHPEEEKLYWVDIEAGVLHSYHPKTLTLEQPYRGNTIGGLALRSDGALLLFQEEGRVRSWHAGKLKDLNRTDPRLKDCRFNDAIVTPSCAIFCGVIAWHRRPRGRLDKYGRRFRQLLAHTGIRPAPPLGLYRWGGEDQPYSLLQEAGLANGAGFSPDCARFYFTDSARREIQVFDRHQGVDNMAARRVFARVPDGEGTPDGLTVDEEGYVWSARWGGGCVVRYDADGGVERQIDLPVQNVTSLAFGGPDYRTLFITTAGGDDRERFGRDAGALFCATPGVRGKPEFLAPVRSFSSWVADGRSGATS